MLHRPKFHLARIDSWVARNFFLIIRWGIQGSHLKGPDLSLLRVI